MDNRELYKNIVSRYQALDEDYELTNRKDRVEVLLSLYTIFGALVTVVSAAYFFISKLNIDLSPQDRMILLVGASGLLLSIFSYFMVSFRRQKRIQSLGKLRYEEYLVEFLESWSEFEAIGRDLLTKQNVDFNEFSIRQIVDLLEKQESLTDEDTFFVADAMRIRNSLVHGSKRIPDEQLRDYSSRMFYINNKLLSRRGLI